MSFAAAGFLAGLAALALPWWLHRRHSHRASPRVVASLQLMRVTDMPAHRHRVLRHRVLLGCRWLLLAVLVLSFAQPLLERAGAAARPEPVLPRLVVLDSSLSMSASFAEAQAAALALLEELPPGVPAAVVAAAAELTLLAPLTDDRAALRAAVGAAVPGAERLALDGLLGRLGGLAAGLSGEPLEIHLLSDFQRSAMPEQFNALLEPLDHPVVLHPVAADGDNLQVAAVTVGERIEVRLRSFGASSGEVPLTLYVDGSESGRQTVPLEAGGEAVASFDAPPGLAAGAAVAARTAAADARPGDDGHFAVVNARQAVPLPMFVGAGAQAQADYLTTAVAAAADRYRPAPPEVRGRVAVVVDPGGLDAAAGRRLADHVNEGGSLLITVGPETRRDGRLTVPELGFTAGHLPRDTSGVTVLDRSHPALGSAAGWRHVTVFRHLVAEPGDARSVLLAADDGAPLLLELPLPAGRALLLTTALDSTWSTLAASPVFVEFVADALAYLADDLVPEQAVAGQTLTVPATSVQVFDAGGARQLSLQDTVGRTGFRLSRPGVYTLRTPDRARLLAVNADPRESDPTPAAPALLARWQAAVRAGVAARGGAADATSVDASTALPLAPGLLLLLLVLAASEALGANLAGRGAAT